MLDHFDFVAPYYDRIFQRHGVPLLADFVAAEPSHRLLDVGGGTGRVAQYFAGRVAQTCILDASPGMLAEGRRKGICITHGLAEEIPFPANTFERIMVVDAFHHLLDHRRAAAEFLRVLTPGGRLVIEEPDIAHWGVKLVALAEKLALMRSHFYRAQDLAKLFARPGVQVWIERRAFTCWVIVDKRD